MTTNQTGRRIRRAPKPTFVAATFADALLIHGQRLRANEAMVATTLNLTYAAKWQQAKVGAR